MPSFSLSALLDKTPASRNSHSALQERDLLGVSGRGQGERVALLTVCGAAAGAVAGAVAHLDALPPHLQQARVGQARLAGVAETLLVVTAIVWNVHRRPGRPGSRLF